MRETTPAAMPPCFHKWCQCFDDLLRNKSQKREFRHYLGGLLGESEIKNLSQMARDTLGVTYHKLHYFLTKTPFRDKRSLKRYFILVFGAYILILWHKLTGGLRRRWANKPLNTFPEALSAFRTAISYRFLQWLQKNSDLFTAY